MRSNPFLDFHRAAEAAGYPALLIASAACLGLVVAPIALLALTQASWVLGVALLSLLGAVAILAGAVDAALSDYGEPASGQTGAGVAAADERRAVTSLPREQSTPRQAGPLRKAA